MASHGIRSDWPMPYEYDEALLQRRMTFSDPDIQSGTLHEEHAGKPLHLNAGGSPHVCIYRVGNWVVRCFTSDPPRNVFPPHDIITRYKEITAYQSRLGHALPFLARHTLIERGIKIKGQHFPYVKIPYIQHSLTLADFLDEHHENQRALGMLAREWLKLIEHLETWHIAHGDLDLSNVLVCGTFPALSLHLVDFDGMYVPTFAHTSMNVTDNGHIHFQPTTPGIRTFGPTMDRFSALIIYLSLCALEMNSSLWEQCGANDHGLLLKAEDFQRLNQSTNFPLLRREQQNRQLQLCLDELQASIDARRMPRALNELLNVGYVVNPPPHSSPPSPHLHEPVGRRITPLGDDPAIGASHSTTQQQQTIPSQPPTQPLTATQPAQPKPERSGRTTLIVLAIVIFIIIVLLILLATSQHSSTSSASAAILLPYLVRVKSSE